MSTSPLIGISFSADHARSLGLDSSEALQSCCRWPISVMRLGAYWDQLEREAGHYDFSMLLQQLTTCQQFRKQVVLTVGVKAPRWPEFYFPKHVQPDLNLLETQTALLHFVEAVILATRRFENILIWQVENEPLDPSGPDGLVVPQSFLEQESVLVRGLDPRPQMITVWGNNLIERGNHTRAAQLADVVGIDLYYKQFVARVIKNLYRGPKDTDEQISESLLEIKKPVWIAELQAEPWEQNQQRYLGKHPGSLNIQQLQSNWDRASGLPVQGILFWGAEYWLWQAQQGNPAYVEWISSLLPKT